MSKFEEILANVPLEIKVRTDIEFFFLEKYGGSFCMPADESSQEYKDVLEANTKCMKEAKPLIDAVMKTIREHEKD